MILVTGATGYVGRHLIRLLLDSGFSVFTLGRDLSLLDRLSEIPDTVIHLAGKIQIAFKKNPMDSIGATFSPVMGEEDIEELYLSNINLTMKILNYCVKNQVKHLIFASSQTVYGMPNRETVTEDSVCRPLEFYGMTKLVAEKILSMGEKQGVCITILRFPGIYGGDKTSGTVYRFCQFALTEKKIEVDIDYPLPCDVIHIEDVINAIRQSILFCPKTPRVRYFNIATGEQCSLNILADSIAELVPGCQVKHSLIPQPVIRMNSDRAEVLLDWKAISRRERLSDLCQHIQNQI